MNRSFASLCALVLTSSLMACSSNSSSSDGETDQGALIPAKAFTTSCEIATQPGAAKAIKGFFEGSFSVSNDGNLSGTKNPLFVSITTKGSNDHQLVVKSGKVIDAKNDILEFVAAETILKGKVQTFDVSVRYDGTKHTVDIDSLVTGKQTYDGTCTFRDDSGADQKFPSAS